MKNKIKWILISCLCFLWGGSLAKGETDTLYISETATTYLVFETEVDLVDIGRPGEYFAKIEGQAVFLKAKDSLSGSTTILVRSGADFFTRPIAYAYQPPQQLYDFRESGKAKPEVLGMFGLLENSVNGARIKERLYAFSEERERIKGRKASVHGLKITVLNIRNDSEATYLGLFIENPSSIDYKVDFVGFSLEEKQGRKFSKNNRSGKDILPLASIVPEPAIIPAHGQEKLFYALPLYAMTSRGKLHIVLREKAGSRIIRVSIPAARINNAPTF